ncbi:SpoIID/LytB domain-containing protein [Candidatus Babeliales bacterium]|nr:SpoIID/LytB domain-containing protein [Candidatus Babeliales bacterium]
MKKNSTLVIIFCSTIIFGDMFVQTIYANPTNESQTSDPEQENIEATPTPDLTELPSKPIFIHVLLNELDAQTRSSHTISSSNGFVLESPIGLKKALWKKNTKITIIVKENTLYLQCKDGKYRNVINNNLAVTPIDGILHFDNRSYQGTLNIRIDKEKKALLLINKISLDDYIYSVLRFESLSYWPLEMQKVQAVASRTYAVYQMLEARTKRGKNVGYDIKNTNFHQVYRGAHDCTHLRKAVEETHNLILTHNKGVALTMFDICCGGVVPSDMKKADPKKPYLYRTNQCTFCEKKSLFKWQEHLCPIEMLKQLKANKKVAHHLRPIKEITHMVVHERDKAGIAHKIRIANNEKSVIVPAADVKASLETKLKSLALDVKLRNEKVMLTGRGFGHNLGLCQLGARELVAQGWNFKDILAFYYPSTNLARLRPTTKATQHEIKINT